MSRETTRVRTRLTRLGRGAVLSALCVAAAGYNTGNNLLLLLLSALLVYLVIAWRLSRRAVRRLEASVGPFLESFAREEVPVRIEVRNRGRGVPLVRLALEGAVESNEGLLPYLPARKSFRYFHQVRFPRRGLCEVRLQARCSFPSGLVESRAVLDPGEMVLVYPEIDLRYEVPEPDGGLLGEEVSGKAGWGVDLLNLREYISGEDARAIDWKATARVGKPIVRVTAREEERTIVLVVDPTVDSPDSTEARDAVERAISRAATAAVHLKRAGRGLRLVVPETVFGRGPGGGELRAILETLALLPVTGPALSPGWWGCAVRLGERVLLYGAAPEEEPAVAAAGGRA